MSTNSGGNPRFRGPGMQWKSGWKRKRIPRDRFDMPFFLRFVAGEGDIGDWYEGTDAFTGGPGTYLGCAIQVPVGFPAGNHSLMGCFGTNLGGPAGWRLDFSNTRIVSLTVGLGLAGGLLTVQGPAAVPGVTYVFVCEVSEPTPGNTRVTFWVPGAGGVAQLFGTANAAFGYNSPSLAQPFRFGVVDPAADIGAAGLHLAGLTMGGLSDVVVPTAYTQFFLTVRDTLSIPSYPLNDRIAAAAVYPAVPNPYTTDEGSTLAVTGGLQSMLNVKFFPNFPY